MGADNGGAATIADSPTRAAVERIVAVPADRSEDQAAPEQAPKDEQGRRNSWKPSVEASSVHGQSAVAVRESTTAGCGFGVVVDVGFPAPEAVLFRESDWMNLSQTENVLFLGLMASCSCHRRCLYSMAA